MTVEQLKKLLRKAKLPLSGNKSALLKRLADAGIKHSDDTKQDNKDTEEIKLTDKQRKKLKIGSLIINIHNNLGGDANNPFIQRVSKEADALPKPLQDHVESVLQPHIKAAKKHPKVVTTKPISKIGPAKLSVKGEKLKEKVKEELKQIKKSSGMDPDFKASLESLFGGPK